jgi:hypothetical protein
MFIYVLSLQFGKYYIGKTENPDFSFEYIYSYPLLKNNYWIQKYYPLSISEFFEVSSSELVWKTLDIIVLKYMNQYGILHVRGGSFSDIILGNHQMIYLKKNMNRYGNGIFCVICGSRSHLDEDCNKEVCLSDSGGLCDGEYNMIEKLKSNCSRCGRFGHETVYCIAIIHQNGALLALPSK